MQKLCKIRHILVLRFDTTTGESNNFFNYEIISIPQQLNSYRKQGSRIGMLLIESYSDKTASRGYICLENGISFLSVAITKIWFSVPFVSFSHSIIKLPYS